MPKREFISNIDEANQVVATLDGELATAQSQLSTAQADLTKAQGDLQAANTKLGEVQGELTKAQGDLSTAQARITELENASKTSAQQATTIVAKTGTKPVTSNGGGADKPDFTNLKGLAKAQAAAKAKAEGLI